MTLNDLSGKIIELSIKIHKTLGPGLLESTYHRCLEYELAKAKIPFLSEVMLPVKYETLNIESGYRADLVVDDQIIIELKSVDKIADIHKAQTLTYLKMSGMKLALLINFRETLLKNGLHRFINTAPSAHPQRTLCEENDNITEATNA